MISKAARDFICWLENLGMMDKNIEYSGPAIHCLKSEERWGTKIIVAA